MVVQVVIRERQTLFVCRGDEGKGEIGRSLGLAAAEAAKTGKISSVASNERASQDAKEAQVTHSFTTPHLIINK
jgi:hypothetical protein